MASYLAKVYYCRAPNKHMTMDDKWNDIWDTCCVHTHSHTHTYTDTYTYRSISDYKNVVQKVQNCRDIVSHSNQLIYSKPLQRFPGALKCSLSLVQLATRSWGRPVTWHSAKDSHKVGKPQKVTDKEAGYVQSAVLKHTHRKLSGRNRHNGSLDQTVYSS